MNAVVYYSRTGNTMELANKVADSPDSPTSLVEIRPTKRRSYPNWLVRSFVPGSRVPIHLPDIDYRGIDVLFIGTPKWTLSCPPVTEYVESAPLNGVDAAVFMTYGGFDGERYMENLTQRIERRGASVHATLSIRSGRVQNGDYTRAVENFVEEALD